LGSYLSGLSTVIVLLLDPTGYGMAMVTWSILVMKADIGFVHGDMLNRLKGSVLYLD